MNTKILIRLFASSHSLQKALTMKKTTLILLLSGLIIAGCKDKEPIDLIFTPQDDVELGQQLHDDIIANPTEYPLLDPVQYAEAYAYLQAMADKLVATGKLSYADEFDYTVYIINDDVLNAFAAPGGKMYFYTGLLKFLENEDDVMGVMGHEIAHADRRHSVKQLAENNGVQFLINAALGDDPSAVSSILGQVAGKGAALKFSRSHESEADEYSVIYLGETEYRCDGAAVFFQKLDSAGLSSSIPEFLSTHPNPDNRIEAIQAKASELGCSTTYYAPASFNDFKALLP